MKRIIAIVPALALFTACGGFEPAEGEWTLDGAEVTEDSCGMLSGEGGLDLEGESLNITLTDDGFSMTDDGLDVSCELSGKTFECTPQSEEESYDQVDITTTYTSTIGGTFTDAETFDGSLTLELSCEGEDCGMLEDQLGAELPCTATVELSGAFVADSADDEADDEA